MLPCALPLYMASLSAAHTIPSFALTINSSARGKIQESRSHRCRRKLVHLAWAWLPKTVLFGPPIIEDLTFNTYLSTALAGGSGRCYWSVACGRGSSAGVWSWI